MGAGIYDMAIEQGATKSILVTYQGSTGGAIDITGYQGRGQIRLKPSDAAPLASFVVTVTDSSGGVVDVTLPSTALSGVALKGASYVAKTTAVYDIELYDENGVVIRLLNGKCTISPEVTK